MGAFLDKPKTEKHNEAGEGNGLRYGLASMQGWRVEMEDAHSAVTGLGPFKDWSFFGVFDGHAGGKVSDFCASDLLQQILKSEPFKSINTSGENQDEAVKLGIYTGFLNMDDLLREKNSSSGGEDRSGSTAICVLVSPTQIYFANCGDSRAVLCQNGQAVHHTTDHKPVLPEEKTRIIKAGGSVMIQRVNGSLAVSRALGDFEYKNLTEKGPCEQLVSPEPEITIRARTERDEFVVLACDGIWDVMSNQELCDFITSRLLVTDDLKDICNQVVDTCLHKGSRDNMSIVLVTFTTAPRVSPEAVQKEKELEKKIADKVQACVDANDVDLDFSTVWAEVNKDPMEGLPPGGGFASKRSYTETIFTKLRRIDPNNMNDSGSSN